MTDIPSQVEGIFERLAVMEIEMISIYMTSKGNLIKTYNTMRKNQMTI